MAERPLECSECKKPTCITYSEIVKGKIHTLSCCASCPFVKQKLETAQTKSDTFESPFNKSLTCFVCQTTSEEIMRGAPLGCARCYEVFGEMIVTSLIEGDALAVQDESKLSSLHIGLTPEKACENQKQLIEKLESLNVSLNEALALENYEEAAHIRDQIQSLTKRKHAG